MTPCRSSSVPPKNHGWVDFAAVGKKVTGTRTFDNNRFPWTAEATATATAPVPVGDSPAGSTTYLALTGTTPPGVTPPGGTGGSSTPPLLPPPSPRPSTFRPVSTSPPTRAG
ncbi:hypothetical protein [Streptomyces sp. GS7]|uniref:hypothetical protein n=1 Tax=Streptomyces sp. GS7 TaxID=2692234 RepID=UPI001F226AFD|nr:hypothetical protein [Streptomyces sp. GS7]